MASPAAVLDILLVANTKQANAALAKTQGQLAATGKTATATGLTMKKAFFGIGIAAGAAATAMFKIGEEFDEVSDTIRTKTGATGKDLAKLEGSFKKVVSSVPTDFGSAADAIAGLNQRLGLTGRPLEKLTKQVTQLALVTGTDVKENVEAVTRLFGDWEVATKDQTETLDGLFRLSQQTGTSVSELSRNLVQFGAPLRNLGVDMDFAAAMFANFEKTGVNMTTVLSGLRLGVGNLNTPTDELAKTLDKLDISLKNPQTALVEIFDSIRTLDKQAATALGIEAFGKRAGPDLVDTVRGGKFELDKLTQSFRNGDETISKAERSTRDFSEQWTLFVNRAKTFLQPVATAFFKAVGDAMKALNRLDLNKAIQSLRDFWKSAGLLRETIGKVASAVKENLRGLAQFIKGAVQTISGVLTGDFGKAWDGVKNIFHAGVRNVVAIFKGITAPIREVAERIADILKNAFEGAFNAVGNIVEDAVNAILNTMHRMTNTINKGFGAVFDLTNQALDKFGAKGKVKWDVSSVNPFQKGGVVKAQTGILVPGSGSGDKVPAMLEPGEVVLNRNAVKAMGGADRANRINKMIPRFASGGVIQQALGPYDIPPIAYDANHAGGNAHLHLDFYTQGQAISYGKKMEQMGWSIGEYSGPYPWPGNTVQHQSPGHYDGTAFDANKGVVESRADVAAVAKLLTSGVAGGAVGAAIEQIKRVMLQGPDGPLKAMGQAAIDKVRQAANSYLGKQSPAMNTTGLDSSSYKGPLDRVFPEHTLANAAGHVRLSPAQVTEIANKAGLPGSTFEKIAHGESQYYPGIVGSDAAAGYGNTFGHGLWQITSGPGGMGPPWGDLIQQLGGRRQMFNPITNSIAAKHIYDAQGIGAWYGTQYLAKGGKVKGGGPFITGNNNPWDIIVGPNSPIKPGQGSQPGGYTFGQGNVGVGVSSAFTTLPKHMTDALFWLAASVESLEEQISTAETLAGFVSSEFGTDLGPGEKAQQIALNDQLLAALLESTTWLNKALDVRGLPADTYSDLRSSLHTIQGVTGQGGKILSVRRRLDELSASSTSTTTDNSAELISLLQAQLLSTQRALNVSQAQYGVFAGMRGAGGKVGAGQWAIAGERGPEVVTGPAQVYSNSDSARMMGSVTIENITIHESGRVTMKLAGSPEFEAAVRSVTRKDATGRPMPGVRG